MLRLHVTPAQGKPLNHLLSEESLIVGRGAGAGLSLADPFLSRQHSRFFRRGDRVFVEDLGSRNGTLVNGVAVSAPTEIAPGDVIEISGSIITVADSASPAAAAAMPGPAMPLAAAGLRRSEGAEPGLRRSEDAEGGLGQRRSEGSHEGTHEGTVFLRAADFLDSQEAAATTGEQALRLYAERLKILNEVHQALGRPISLDTLLELILDRVFDHLRPEQGVILLRRADGEMARAASRSAAHRKDVFIESRSLMREVTEKGLAALVLDAQTDERFAGAESILISGVRSLVAAPLLDPDGGAPLGMIALDSKLTHHQFSQEDLELLVCLASVAALHIRDVALAEQAAERRRLGEELALARRIQLALLPSRLPEIAGYEIHGGNIPSRGVSGDYFTVTARRDGAELVLMIADVSGKGMAASLLTASLEALAAGPIEDGLPPGEIFARLSRQLYRRTPPEKYATAFLAVLTPATGELAYTNAGHNPPLLVRACGAVEELAATGMPLALLPGAEYAAERTVLGPGDTLVLYTDGFVEAADPEGAEYGLERMAEVGARHRGEGCQAVAAALETDLEAFVRGVPYADDRTLLMVRRLP
jgi:sigma-B regulation protein RsbU (phosphoserine phosphatase)